MPDPEPPPDLSSFLKNQRELNRAMLKLIQRVESQMQLASSLDKAALLSAAMLPLDPPVESSAGLPAKPQGRPSYRFFYFVLGALAILAGFLVIKSPPAPSLEEQHLRQELAAQKNVYEIRIRELTSTLKGNQEALIGTQVALGDVQKELLRTQAALRDARQAPPAK